MRRRGLQFGLAYTYSKAVDYGGTQPLYRSAREFSYAPSSFDQTHILTINYTYQVPGLSRVFQNSLVNLETAVGGARKPVGLLNRRFAATCRAW